MSLGTNWIIYEEGSIEYSSCVNLVPRFEVFVENIEEHAMKYNIT